GERVLVDTIPVIVSSIGASGIHHGSLSPAVLGLIAFQAPAAQPKAAAPAPAPSQPAAPRPGGGGLILPRTISTEIEFEDVDLNQLLARVQAMGIRVPVPLAGRLTLKAKATIPLGALRDVKEYAFNGEATLKGASIAGVDLGLVAARLVLDKGVLDLSDFRGRLVDRPAGGAANPPEATEPVPAEGPLPPGGFRGQLHAEISPPGKLTARFEGRELPVGELAAPALPQPTPLSGLVTVDVRADGSVATLADPKAWTASGHLESVRISYRQTTLDAVSTSVSLKEGRLDVPDLAAKLAGHPLTAKLTAELAAPYAFDGHLDVADWSLADVLAFVPSAPRPAPIAGRLTARAQASGTLAPMKLQTGGEGRIAEFRAGPVPLGEVPFRWATEGDTVVISGVEAQPFGGKVTAEARVPATGGGRPAQGSATVTGIDTARLAALVPDGGLTLTGTASGKVDFAIPTAGEPGGSAVQANVQLAAPDLTVQGIPAQGVAASLWVRQGVLNYEILAESLGGKIRFKGDVPLGAAAAEGQAAVLNAQVQAVAFRLEDLWRILKVTGTPSHLGGLGALDANIRTALRDPRALSANGVVEVRNLRWGEHFPLGRVRGTVVLTPSAWQVESFTGELLGGQ
ncbi:MAG TPA: YdbH domain-containing protein, partial [Isosphaeraceae bacterium]